MALLAGPRWRNGEHEEAWLQADAAGRVLDEGTGRPPGPAEPAAILDGLANWHTHIGDAFLEGRDLPRDLAALVAPSTGYKHRMLAQATPDELGAGMRAHLRRMADHGVVEALDFREQGLAGIRLARAAADAVSHLRLHLLGRPEGRPRDEAAALAAVAREADGIGCPSLTDWGTDAVAAAARAAHAAAKPLALHVSEGRREDMDAVLGHDPDLLVHACHATPQDLAQVSDARVPIVLCPTSNAHFGHRTPDPVALDAQGIPWYLGTDNAMLGAADPLAQARLLHQQHPRVADASLLRALTTLPGKGLKRLVDQSYPAARRILALPLGRRGTVRWDLEPRRLVR